MPGIFDGAHEQGKRPGFGWQICTEMRCAAMTGAATWKC
jgi:hypothetical protein